jgi:hypothetical protein
LRTMYVGGPVEIVGALKSRFGRTLSHRKFDSDVPRSIRHRYWLKCRPELISLHQIFIFKKSFSLYQAPARYDGPHAPLARLLSHPATVTSSHHISFLSVHIQPLKFLRLTNVLSCLSATLQNAHLITARRPQVLKINSSAHQSRPV